MADRAPQGQWYGGGIGPRLKLCTENGLFSE